MPVGFRAWRGRRFAGGSRQAWELLLTLHDQRPNWFGQKNDMSRESFSEKIPLLKDAWSFELQPRSADTLEPFDLRSNIRMFRSLQKSGIGKLGPLHKRIASIRRLAIGFSTLFFMSNNRVSLQLRHISQFLIIPVSPFINRTLMRCTDVTACSWPGWEGPSSIFHRIR